MEDSPVDTAKKRSPSLEVCDGLTERASPSWAAIESLLQSTLLISALVITTPIVVFWNPLFSGFPFKYKSTES